MNYFQANFAGRYKSLNSTIISVDFNLHVQIKPLHWFTTVACLLQNAKMLEFFCTNPSARRHAEVQSRDCRSGSGWLSPSTLWTNAN